MIIWHGYNQVIITRTFKKTFGLIFRFWKCNTFNWLSKLLRVKTSPKTGNWSGILYIINTNDFPDDATPSDFSTWGKKSGDGFPYNSIWEGDKKWNGKFERHSLIAQICRQHFKMTNYTFLKHQLSEIRWVRAIRLDSFVEILKDKKLLNLKCLWILPAIVTAIC